MPHEVPAEGKGFICHKHMGLCSLVLISWKQGIFRELESAIYHCLAKGGVCQGPSITSPPITANINHTETVFSIHNCQKLSIDGSQIVWKVPSEMGLQTSLVVRHVFFHQAIPYCPGYFCHNAACCGMPFMVGMLWCKKNPQL